MAKNPSEIDKELDKLVSGKVLDADTRSLCYRLLREGSEAQALRAVAVLSHLGDTTIQLPAVIVAGSWPNLPTRDLEIKAIWSLVKQDSSLSKTFVVALLSKAGPSNKVRESYFWEFVEQQADDHPIARFASALAVVGRALEREATSTRDARRRLVDYVSKILKKYRRDVDSKARHLIFGSLAFIYESNTLHDQGEAARLVNLLLSQVTGRDAVSRVSSLRETMNQFRELGAFLRIGRGAPKIGKPDSLKRTQIADDAIVFACFAIEESDRDFARWLLSIVLPAQTGIDEWLGRARGCLTLMQTGTTGNDHVLSLLQVVHETGLANDVSFADVQDCSPSAATAITKVIKVLTSEIRRLTHENVYLKSPEGIRKIAGTLVDEELGRQGELMAKFQEHAKQKRKELAERLRKVLDGLRASSRTDIEGVVSDVIAFLEGRS